MKKEELELELDIEYYVNFTKKAFDYLNGKINKVNVVGKANIYYRNETPDLNTKRPASVIDVYLNNIINLVDSYDTNLESAILHVVAAALVSTELTFGDGVNIKDIEKIPEINLLLLNEVNNITRSYFEENLYDINKALDTNIDLKQLPAKNMFIKRKTLEELYQETIDLINTYPDSIELSNCVDFSIHSKEKLDCSPGDIFHVKMSGKYNKNTKGFNEFINALQSKHCGFRFYYTYYNLNGVK